MDADVALPHGGCFSEHQDIDDKHSRAETGTDSGTETDETGSPTAGDADGDGVTAEDGDCNDADHTIHPGASEILDDGIDQDCDGVDAVTCNGDYLYADAAACGVITGDLLISTDAMTLDGLGGLTHIGGNLTVIGNAATSFSLDGLTHVGGNLSIHFPIPSPVRRGVVFGLEGRVRGVISGVWCAAGGRPIVGWPSLGSVW